MKKVLLILGIIVGVLVGALLLWKVVFPFLGWAFGGIFGVLGLSFENFSDSLTSLFN